MCPLLEKREEKEGGKAKHMEGEGRHRGMVRGKPGRLLENSADRSLLPQGMEKGQEDKRFSSPGEGSFPSSTPPGAAQTMCLFRGPSMVNCHQHSMGGGERRRRGEANRSRGEGRRGRGGGERRGGGGGGRNIFLCCNLKTPKRDKQGNTCKILSMHPSRNYHKCLTQEYFKSAENILNTKIYYVKMAIIEK